MSLLVLEDVHTFYGEAHILQGVSLTVGEGEVVTLIGRNGAGKTTTLRSIMGIVRARRGHVRLRGEDITALDTHEVARRGIAWIPEERRVLPNLTVLENLRLGMIAGARPNGGGDVLNLREGPDLASAAVVGVLDADKPGGGEMLVGGPKGGLHVSAGENAPLARKAAAHDAA